MRCYALHLNRFVTLSAYRFFLATSFQHLQYMSFCESFEEEGDSYRIPLLKGAFTSIAEGLIYLVRVRPLPVTVKGILTAQVSSHDSPVCRLANSVSISAAVQVLTLDFRMSARTISSRDCLHRKRTFCGSLSLYSDIVLRIKKEDSLNIYHYSRVTSEPQKGWYTSDFQLER